MLNAFAIVTAQVFDDLASLATVFIDRDADAATGRVNARL